MFGALGPTTVLGLFLGQVTGLILRLVWANLPILILEPVLKPGSIPATRPRAILALLLGQVVGQVLRQIVELMFKLLLTLVLGQAGG